MCDTYVNTSLMPLPLFLICLPSQPPGSLQSLWFCSASLCGTALFGLKHIASFVLHSYDSVSTRNQLGAVMFYCSAQVNVFEVTEVCYPVSTSPES